MTTATFSGVWAEAGDAAPASANRTAVAVHLIDLLRVAAFAVGSVTGCCDSARAATNTTRARPCRRWVCVRPQNRRQAPPPPAIRLSRSPLTFLTTGATRRRPGET